MNDPLTKQLEEVLNAGAADKPQLLALDDAVRGVFESPFLPSEGNSAISREYRQLITRAEMPILNVIIRAAADRMLVDGVTSAGEPINNVWDWWQASSLDARQAQVYTDALTYGDGYLLVTPDSQPGGSTPNFTVESPLVLSTIHDPINPMGVQTAAKQVGDDRAWLYTDEAIYAFQKPPRGPRKWTLVEEFPHGLGVCPIVRFPNRLDSAGRSLSEIMECLPIQRRINQTTMTRLLLEASAAWRQRYVSGIDVEHDADGKPIPPFRMGVDKLLVAPDSDTSFGEFSASSTQDLMAATEQDIRHIAVITQTPTTMFGVTSISNISSESLAALEGGLARKVAIKQSNFGESLEYAMRLGGAMHNVDVPTDLEMEWKDLEVSSLSQRSNAFVQLRGSGMPMEYLLESTMNLTPQTIERVMDMIKEERAEGRAPDQTKGNGAIDATKVPQAGEEFLRGNQNTPN